MASITKIIGIGSPFGVDTLGWQVIDALADMELPDTVILEKLDRPGVHLLEHLKNCERVILVDAVISDDPVGTVYELSGDEIAQINPHTSSHDFGLADTLALGKALNQPLPEIWFVGMHVSAQEIQPSARRIEPCVDKIVALMTHQEAQ